MSNMICRLCLNDGKLIDIFDYRLTNSEQLKKCILLGTGVEICPEDVVTKYICHYCSDIAIFLYKYRRKALENDKYLKELANQPFVEPKCQSTKDMVGFNRAILDQLVVDGDSRCQVNGKLESNKPTGTAKLAVDPTIIELIKTHPTLKIPNDLLKRNIKPWVVLDKSEVENWKPPAKVKEGAPTHVVTDIERFRQKCPAIQIKRITEQLDQPPCVIGPQVQQSGINTSAIKNKLAILLADVPPKKRLSISDARVRAPKKRSAENILPKKSPHIKTFARVPTPLPTEQYSADVENLLPTTSQASEQVTITEYQQTSEVDLEEEEEIMARKPKRRRVLSTDSESTQAYNDVGSCNLLDTVDEEIVVSCGICNKMFSTRQQLRSHERVHRCCIICNKIFRSSDALFYHQQEICFKAVIANPPDLQLTRVDEDPNIMNRYPETFFQSDTLIGNKGGDPTLTCEEILCISDDDDDDDVVVVDETQPNVDSTSASVANNQEFQHICKVFQKYKEIPLMKHKNTETKLNIVVKYNQKNQIVLENMYQELLTFRVPIDLVEKATSFAYISFAKKPVQTQDIYCWANKPVVELATKTAFPSLIINTQIVPAIQPTNPQNILVNQLQQSPLLLPHTAASVITKGFAQGNSLSGIQHVQIATSASIITGPPQGSSLNSMQHVQAGTSSSIVNTGPTQGSSLTRIQHVQIATSAPIITAGPPQGSSLTGMQYVQAGTSSSTVNTGPTQGSSLTRIQHVQVPTSAPIITAGPPQVSSLTGMQHVGTSAGISSPGPSQGSLQKTTHLPLKTTTSVISAGNLQGTTPIGTQHIQLGTSTSVIDTGHPQSTSQNCTQLVQLGTAGPIISIGYPPSTSKICTPPAQLGTSPSLISPKVASKKAAGNPQTRIKIKQVQLGSSPSLKSTRHPKTIAHSDIRPGPLRTSVLTTEQSAGSSKDKTDHIQSGTLSTEFGNKLSSTKPDSAVTPEPIPSTSGLRVKTLSELNNL